MRIVRDGWPFILGFLALGAGLAAAARGFQSPGLAGLAGTAALLAGFFAYFFRDPARVIPNSPHLVLSPADGRILEVVEGSDPAYAGPVRIVRIFLSVFDPHLQRAPVSGTVKKIAYTKGKFLDARNPKAAFENEQNRIEIAPDLPSPEGRNPVVVTQIAGLIARRIVCWVHEDQRVPAGAVIGMIRFGSQVDIALPLSARVEVKAGDRVTAGDSVLAIWER